jgi:NADH-quinone oxidoreductase subunit I
MENSKPGPPHSLTLESDGSYRCVACLLCVSACPANCIVVHAESDVDGDAGSGMILKSFAVDYLHCMKCGVCVDSCPYCALELDTDKQASPVLSRTDAIVNLRE